MLRLLDLVMTIAHLALMAFNLAGWIWESTRRLHLVTLCLTIASWFVLGIWYGWGYCPLTEWQWRIKNKLGEDDLPNSFVKYLADKLTGKSIDAGLIDSITLGCLAAAIVAAVYVNFIRTRRAS